MAHIDLYALYPCEINPYIFIIAVQNKEINITSRHSSIREDVVFGKRYETPSLRYSNSVIIFENWRDRIVGYTTCKKAASLLRELELSRPILVCYLLIPVLSLCVVASGIIISLALLWGVVDIRAVSLCTGNGSYQI